MVGSSWLASEVGSTYINIQSWLVVPLVSVNLFFLLSSELPLYHLVHGYAPVSPPIR